MGKGVCGLFITHCLSRSSLLSRRTPHTLPLLRRGVPPTGDSPSWTNCPSFWSLMGSQVLSPNLLQCGLLSPQGHRSCQEAVHSMGFPQGHSLLRASTCSTMGLHVLQGTASLTMVFSMGCRGISSPAVGAPPLPSPSLALVSAELFLSHILTPLSCCNCCFPS